MIFRLFGKEHLVSSDAYIKYLKAKGVKIGDNMTIWCFGGGLTKPLIDVTRPSLVEIGDNVGINRNFTLLTHDFITGVFKECYGDFVPSSGKVKIGNNVVFGFDCMVLKGVTIGDNCFIAAGSLVTKDIPANSVAAGRPAKVICSIEELYNKRKNEMCKEAFIYARSIKNRFNRMPVAGDFFEEFPLFVDARNVHEYPELERIMKKKLGKHYTKWLGNHKAPYNGIAEFLDAAFEKCKL